MSVDQVNKLILAPHADDEVLGVGGTIARAVAAGERIVVAVLTGHGAEPHPLWPRSNWAVVRAECLRANELLGVAEVVFRDLPAACLDVVPAWKVNSVVDALIEDFDPEEIFMPFGFDLHQDHGVISYATVVATRPYLMEGTRLRRVLAYETLTETHLYPPPLAPAFHPNVHVDISEFLEQKLNAMRCYASQLQDDRKPRSLAGLQALATLRGTHIGVEAAEAFVLLAEYHR